MSTNKKGLKLAVLSVIAILGLVACDESSEIYSKPSNYEDKIVTIDGADEEIHHNVLSIIYDAIHDSGLVNEVLEESLYRYASSIFGYYNDVTRPEGNTEVTLKEAVAAYDKVNKTWASTEKVNEFIKAHKSYWYYNDEGEHIKEDKTPIGENEEWTPCDAERDHVVAKLTAIENRIAKAMYAKATSSSYSSKNYFCEKELLRSLRESGEKVVNYLDIAAFEKFIIPYTVEEEEVFDEFEGYDGANHVILHREYYQSSESNDPNAPKATYIEDKILPDVYNDLLVEQYLLDEDVAAVRNSRARKINVIKIEKYSSFTNNADALVNKLVEEIYQLPGAGVTTLETDQDVIEEKSSALFEKYSLIAKGLYDQIQTNPEALAIVNELHAIASDIYEPDATNTYYKNTTYGDLVEDYNKILAVDNYELLGNTKYSTFTSGGTRTVEEGFEQQKIDIMQKDNITKGWFIQSSTPTLDSNGTINERLFKLSVANAKVELVDENSAGYAELEEKDRLVYDNGVWSVRDAAVKTEDKFLCSINGSFFLKFDGKAAGEDWKNDIVYDDGNAYYIVQVFEAAKDAKLRNASSTNYAVTRGQEKMDEIIDEVAKIVGETGNYSSLSKEHWLEKMDIKYHDQAIYDYFLSNYPDLFD